MLTIYRKNTKKFKIERHCVLLLVGLENLAKIRCCNTNFRIEIGKRPLQHISATKSEAGACLAVCLKYQRFQPKRAYKLRAYKRNVYTNLFIIDYGLSSHLPDYIKVGL